MRTLLPRLRGILHSSRTTAIGVVLCLFIFLSGFLDRVRYPRPGIYTQVDRLVALEEYAEPSKLLEEYLKSHPSDDYALRLYGMTLLNLGRKEEGHQAYRRSLAMNPHQPDLREYMEKFGGTNP
jgi:cytochrome c-type biogenesis protein CcmH/NrfG